MTHDPPQRVAIVGLGYVGLQLAVAFGRHLPTVGFDTDGRRLDELGHGVDRTGEVEATDMAAAHHLTLARTPADLAGVDVYIVAVPTPVDKAKRPDLDPLQAACQIVGEALAMPAAGTAGSRRPIVVFESTVYPGCTEEVCVPLIERASGLAAGVDFTVGYSPERINPGDREHTLERIVKVVAGQDDATTDRLAALYGLVVPAGVYLAPDIRTAEAAKVIENVQRDLNIALMNELALLFHRMGLDIRAVLAAARTKWNFLPFEPGLVGGHCIPVDPYYLTHKAQEIGFLPEVILAGRRTNDSMGRYVAQETVRLLIRAGRVVRGSRVLVLGASFKENVKDVRNTRVADLVGELKASDVDVDVFDPLIGADVLEGLGFSPVRDPFGGDRRYDAVVLAVAHRALIERSVGDFLRLLRTEDHPGVLVDIRGVLDARDVIGSDSDRVLYWRL